MARKPETLTTEREREAAPKPFGFDDAFDGLGTSSEDLIQSLVRPASPRGATPAVTAVTYEQASRRVNGVLKRYKQFGDTLFNTARVKNARRPVNVAGRDIASIDMADSAIPGVDQYMQMVRRKVDGHFSADEDYRPTDDEEAFMEALEWGALKEQRLAMGEEVNALDYETSPHGPPYNSYENARNEAIYGNNGLHAQARWLEAEARFKGDTALADDMQQVWEDLDVYREAYIDLPPTRTINRNAASEYGEELNATTPDPATLATRRTTMDEQATLDRVFATYDGQIKGRMKSELDQLDTTLLNNLSVYVEGMQDGIATDSARRMRRVGSFRRNTTERVAGQANYDAAAHALGRQELRVAQRIGVPAANGTFGEKLPRSGGPQVELFLANTYLDRAKALDSKILRELAENRTIGDQAADFWAGRRNGEKEDRKTVNFARRLLKVSSFTAVTLFVPGGIALAAGGMVGSSKIARYKSNHSHELQTRNMASIIDQRDVDRIMKNRTIHDWQKMRELRFLERDSRQRDIRRQQNRIKIDMGKAAAWTAGVGMSPVYAPWVAHAAVGVGQNAYDTTRWAVNRY